MLFVSPESNSNISSIIGSCPHRLFDPAVGKLHACGCAPWSNSNPINWRLEASKHCLRCNRVLPSFVRAVISAPRLSRCGPICVCLLWATENSGVRSDGFLISGGRCFSTVPIIQPGHGLLLQLRRAESRSHLKWRLCPSDST